MKSRLGEGQAKHGLQVGARQTAQVLSHTKPELRRQRAHPQDVGEHAGVVVQVDVGSVILGVSKDIAEGLEQMALVEYGLVPGPLEGHRQPKRLTKRRADPLDQAPGLDAIGEQEQVDVGVHGAKGQDVDTILLAEEYPGRTTPRYDRGRDHLTV